MNGVLMMPDEKGPDQPDEPEAQANRVTVPKEALDLDGALPEVGEEVDLHCVGRVVSTAPYVVEITTANDQPVAAGKAEEPQPEDESMDTLLKGDNADE